MGPAPQADTVFGPLTKQQAPSNVGKQSLSEQMGPGPPDLYLDILTARIIKEPQPLPSFLAQTTDKQVVPPVNLVTTGHKSAAEHS